MLNPPLILPNSLKIQKLFILEKPKSIALMEEVFASSKILIKSFMEISTMDNSKDKDNFILLLETTMLESLGLIKKKDEVYTLGLVKKAMFMRASSKEANETVEELSGGLMVAGMKAISEMEFKADGECCTEKAVIVSMKAIGITVCSTVEAPSTFRTVSDMKVRSNRISSTERVYSTRTTQ